MFKLNVTREAAETWFGERDNMPTEQVRTEPRGRKEDFWLETQTRFIGSWQGPWVALLRSRQQLKNRLQTCEVWKREVRGQRHSGRKVQLWKGNRNFFSLADTQKLKPTLWLYLLKKEFLPNATNSSQEIDGWTRIILPNLKGEKKESNNDLGMLWTLKWSY